MSSQAERDARRIAEQYRDAPCFNVLLGEVDDENPCTCPTCGHRAILRALDPASTPPHEQQNEPSSPPARAPGDEPAEPLGWVVVGAKGGRRFVVVEDEPETEEGRSIWTAADARTLCDAMANAFERHGYTYTVEPVGVWRAPRTSEAP